MPLSLIHRPGAMDPVVATVARIIREVAKNMGRESVDVGVQAARPATNDVTSQLELRQLHYFRTVVNAGSVGRAAQELGITQPALSRQIRRLEHLIDVNLLERRARGIRPTAAGAAFFHNVTSVLAHAASVQREVIRAERGVSAPLVIAAVPTESVQDILKRLALCSGQQSQRADLTFVDISTPAQPAALFAAEIDVGLCNSTPLTPEVEKQLRSVDLMSDEMNCALLAMRHPLASRQSIRLDELEGIPFLFVHRSFQPALHEMMFGAFKQRGFNVLVENTYEGLRTVWTMVAQNRGWGVGFNSQRTQPPVGTVAVPIEGFSLPFGTRALARIDESRPSVLEILDTLSEIAREQTK
jgi:DNA-binding transcriptional LysR family regulator